MSTTELAAVLAQKDAFNAAHPIGTTVRYWIGAREGAGTVAKTTGPASAMSGRAVVYVEGHGRAVELALVEVVGGESVGVSAEPETEPISAPPEPEAEPLFAALSAFEALRRLIPCAGTPFLSRYDAALEQLRNAVLLLPARRGGGG